MSKYKIIALIGESGSGKDTVLSQVLKSQYAEGLHKIVSCTTRPMRENEEDGVTYHFIDTSDFAAGVLSGDVIEASTFNHWFYGTMIQDLSLDKINIGIFDPYRIEALLEREDIDLYIYYIYTTPKERLIRQLNREENPDVDEIIRRYKADIEDFYDLDFEYILIKNNTKDDLLNAPNIIINSIKN